MVNVNGPTRPALYEDFVKFGVEPPEMLQVMREDMKKLYDMIEFISPDNQDFIQKTAEKYGLDGDDSISIIEQRTTRSLTDE